jgi:hypothetical protein
LTRRTHFGFTTVYALSIMTAIIALCSLGADYGRVQVAKGELRRAVDAAARAASQAMRQGKTDAQAQADAIATAAQNSVDVSALALTTSDVVIGKWTGTTFLAGATPSNAVRVSVRLTAASGKAIPLMFARLIGMSSCEISADTISVYAPGAGPPIVGIQGITLSSSAAFASYDSNVGPPSPANMGNAAGLGSNSSITLGSSSSVRGDINLGPAGSTSIGSGFFTTGTTNRMTYALNYPPTESPTVASWGDWVIASGSTIWLPGGTYNYDDIVFGSNCTIYLTGPVTVYLTGNFTGGDNLTVYTYQDRPGNFNLRLVGTGKSYTVGNNYTFTGSIYGPGFNFTAGSGLTVNGTIVVKQIVGTTSASFNYDTRVPSPSMSPGLPPVTTVR